MDNRGLPIDAKPSPVEAEPDGGPQNLDWSLVDEALRDNERGVIQSLGAAVVARWAGLPRDVQKLLFDTATRGEGDAEELRGHIARFLHDNAYSER